MDCGGCFAGIGKGSERDRKGTRRLAALRKLISRQDDSQRGAESPKAMLKRTSQLKIRHRMRDKTKKFEDFYEEKEPLGEGKYGKVLRCSRKSSVDSEHLKDVAVKQLYGKKFAGWCCFKTDRMIDDFTRAELEALSLLDHPNILDFYEWFEEPDRGMYFVMEFLEGDTLHVDFEKICEIKDVETRWQQLPMMKEYFCQSVYGVSYLHSLDPAIVHRDLKPDNIFVVKSGNNYKSHCVKLIDFGLVVNGGTTFASNSTDERHGTRLFMAPEYVLFSKGTMNADLDMWALGIMFGWIYTSIMKGKLLHPLLTEEEAEGYEANANNQKFAKLKSAMNQGREWNGKLWDGRLWSLAGGHFVGIEHDALAVLEKLLTYTAVESEEVPRISAAELLELKWLKSARGDGKSLLSKTGELVNNFKVFQRLATFDRLIVTRSARASSDEDVEVMRQIFVALDKDYSGRLTKDEFTKGLRQADADISVEECQEIFYGLSEDGGGVDWNGWLSAGIGINILKSEGAQAAAFRYLDFNNEGRISRDNLIAALGEEEVDRLKRTDSSFATSDSINANKFRAITTKIVKKRSMILKCPPSRSAPALVHCEVEEKGRALQSLPCLVCCPCLQG